MYMRMHTHIYIYNTFRYVAPYTQRQGGGPAAHPVAAGAPADPGSGEPGASGKLMGLLGLLRKKILGFSSTSFPQPSSWKAPSRCEGFAGCSKAMRGLGVEFEEGSLVDAMLAENGNPPCCQGGGAVQRSKDNLSARSCHAVACVSGGLCAKYGLKDLRSLKQEASINPMKAGGIGMHSSDQKGCKDSGASWKRGRSRCWISRPFSLTASYCTLFWKLTAIWMPTVKCTGFPASSQQGVWP